ncbi:hypothetical protein TNCV_4228941 [Trichonephila clavipes]|nr:hypothetical protein TNCV_4228941 [Trichonephila clavipes]
MCHGHSSWTQLVQETATQKFVDYPDHLVRATALETVYRSSISLDLSRNFMNHGTRLVHKCYKMPNTSAADDLRFVVVYLRRYVIQYLCCNTLSSPYCLNPQCSRCFKFPHHAC